MLLSNLRSLEISSLGSVKQRVSGRVMPSIRNRWVTILNKDLVTVCLLNPSYLTRIPELWNHTCRQGKTLLCAIRLAHKQRPRHTNVRCFPNSPLDNATLTTVKFKIFKSSCIQEFPDSSSGNHIQYSGINHNGKKYKKNIYIYVKKESLCRN